MFERVLTALVASGLTGVEHSSKHYGGLFGWTFEPGPSDGGGFAITAPGTPGGGHGGDLGAGPYVFFRVDGLGAAVSKVRELGGTVDEECLRADDEESAARFGRSRFCRDDQGSSFGLHEPPAAARRARVTAHVPVQREQELSAHVRTRERDRKRKRNVLGRASNPPCPAAVLIHDRTVRRV